MRRPYITQKLAVLMLTVLFAITGIVAAQVPLEPPSGILGKVVDSEGNAIAGFMFTIQPMLLRDGHLQPDGGFLNAFQKPLEGMDGPGMPRTTIRVKTDLEGAFTATNIQPGLVQLNVIPSALLDAFEKVDPEKIRQGEQIPPELMKLWSLEPDKKIISIQVGKVTFFYHNEVPGPAFFEGLTFALKPGVTLKNVKITVKSRMQIRGQIIYADGTPLANTEGRIRMRRRDEMNPNHRSSDSASFFSDADGHFTLYRDEPGYYTLSFQHKGLSAGAGPFLLKDGMTPENLVLTLDGNPVEIGLPADRKIEARGNAEDAKIPAGIEARAALPPQARQPAKSVWIINPANGHAYKKIQCQDWHDAQQKAIEADAHLVSINDEDEQHWLQVIFKGHSLWIGLTDLEKEGEWRWDSGEPVTYTNWATQPVFPDALPNTEKDYVVITFRNGDWQSVGPESHFWRTTREAIIEKDGLISKAPAAEKPGDE